MILLTTCVLLSGPDGANTPGRTSHVPARRITTFLARDSAPGGACRSAVLVTMPTKPVRRSMAISPHPASATSAQMAVGIDHLDARGFRPWGEHRDNARKLGLGFLLEQQAALRVADVGHDLGGDLLREAGLELERQVHVGRRARLHQRHAAERDGLALAPVAAVVGGRVDR